MEHLLTRYAWRLEDEGCVRPGRIALACRNDAVVSVGPPDLAKLAIATLQGLSSTAVVLAEPLLPYSELLLQRTRPFQDVIVPRDSESRATLHDIPLVVSTDDTPLSVSTTAVLARRKGCIIEGVGMATHGSLTVEQAYINWSSLYHATFIKYLEDLLTYGMQVPEERPVVASLLQLGTLPSNRAPALQIGPLHGTQQILDELSLVGRIMVQAGLVDSFFGNISYAAEDALFISQTSARLDELEHQIDRIPYDNSSTAGMTASSELPAHRAIVAATGCRAVLHGHPRFPVVMGFFSYPTAYEGIEQICGIPVVGGEGGQGGLAQTLPRAFTLTKAAAIIVRGHGVFSIGQHDFREAFAALLKTEQACREEFRRRLNEQNNVCGT